MSQQHRSPSPPQPVDVESVQWLSRAWQFVFDRLDHVDQCLDETKEATRDMEAALTASITAGKDGDKSLRQLIEEHHEFHTLMDTTEKAKQSVWKRQGEWLSTFWRLVTDGAVLGGAVLILKALGVHL